MKGNKLRVIPRLDIKGPNLVKGIHLEGLRVLGKPEYFAEYYYQNGADELFFQDTVASLYERNSLSDIISKTAKKIFIPLTVGGGIRSIADIRRALLSGADKVCINTAAIKNPFFIKEATLKFGSSTIVVAIEAIKEYNGKYLAYTDNGREYTGLDVFEWAQKVQELGAGELVITSVDKEGTGEGFDVELVKKITELVDIPVIAHGGCKGSEDALNIFKNTEADGIAISSILHYGCLDKIHSENDFEKEGNISFLKSGNFFGKIKPCTILDIKETLHLNNIPVRL
ncbi:imidazole glycerol phosphate synthase cyclase subunit [Chryseobacterium sp. MYb264]|uniref:imidazole glycerol phosphate synthase subunit HisF n=1 Tax=Chryseobacterium sp. MYb264 TaxID=2745153 RepID=UPI002E0F668A|nr:imidazole glycerol phosphate synthase cyclase subunit [Chryseobacterium sp. MYb264]